MSRKKFGIKYLDGRGIMLVWLALFMLPLLIMFAGLAIDISYMYHVKNQLQVAADAAALAGAEVITSTSDKTQTNARNQAVNFAGLNSAAGAAVVLGNDGSSNTLSSLGANPGNDITVGTWNGTTYTPDTTPVNAVQVRPRRTGGSPGGPVSVFWGKIFNAFPSIGANWSFMSATATAVAARPPRADAYFAVCWQCDPTGTACDGICKDPSSGASCSISSPCTFGTPRAFCPTPSPGTPDPNSQAMGWSSLLTTPCSTTNISDTLLCGPRPIQNVCGNQICVQNGGTSSPKDFEALMYDPLYDSGNKTCNTANAKCISSTNTVTGWTIIVPITEVCPISAGMKAVYGYAQLHLTAACGSGGGSGSVCGNHPYSSPTGTCTHDSVCQNDYIKIDSVACVDCAHMDEMLGTPALVR